jgi:hypothetical protein
MTDMNKQEVAEGAQALDAAGATTTPEQVKPTNPQQVPETGKIADSGRYVLEERSLGAVPIDDTKTVQFTSGSMRPILAKKALPSITRLQAWNASQDTASSEVEPPANEDVGLTLMMRGSNYLNPFSLPVVAASDFDGNGVADESALATKFYQGNGPSISTPGTVKRAEVEAKMNVLKSVIVGYYNRSIPFTDYGVASRLLLLNAYESDLLRLQLIYQSLAVLKGLADWMVKVGIKLSATWQEFYKPDVYAKLAQLYQTIAFLPVVDTSVHDRLEELLIINGACKDQEYPSALHMQNVMVYTNPVLAGKTVQTSSGSYPTSLTPVIDSFSTASVWAAAADGHLSELLQEELKKASSIITQYEVVYSAITQLISKGAMDGKYLSEWLAGDVDAAGSFNIRGTDPVFDWAAHERFEYAPITYTAEVGAIGTSGVYTTKLFQLPAAGASGPASDIVGIRPVGKGHYDEAFTVREMVGVGLFRATDPITCRMSYVNAAGAIAYTDVTVAVPWVDAIYGDFYSQVLHNVGGGRNGVANDAGVGFYGLSFYASGLHNVLDMPFMAGSATAIQNIFCGAGTAYCSSAPAFSSAEAEEGLRWFWERVAELMNLHFIVMPRANATGVRRIPLTCVRGYAMCEFFELNLIAVDNALANAYGNFMLDIRMKEVKAATR